MVTIQLGKREIPLIFTVLELRDVQKEVGPVLEIEGRLKEVFEKPEELDTLGKMIVILGNAGLEEKGEAPDLTLKKVLRTMKPYQVIGMVNSCLDALLEGMLTENAQKEREEAENGPVDEGLEMLNKKNESGT